jgi:3-hydroxyacyl-[acyl-carrier-protein] dehydratase
MEAPLRFELVDIHQILKTLPHRYPMLLIDKVINIRTDHSGIGIKNVTYNEPHFQGHFPQKPVMPGVLIIEGMAQTAGAICLAARPGKPQLVYFLTIDNAKFRKPVEPGDVLEYHVRKVRNRGNLWRFQSEAKVAGVKVAEADISAMLVGQ